MAQEMTPASTGSSQTITITPDSRLSHDVLPVKPLQVDDEAVAGTAVDLDADGNLVMLSILAKHGEGDTAVEHVAVELCSSPSSASGYETILLPEGANASEVVVAVDAGGMYHAFYAAQGESFEDGAVLHCRREPDGEWGTADSLPHATGLAATTVPLSGDLVVSGVDADGQLLLYSSDGDDSHGIWSGARVEVPGGKLTPLNQGGEGGARVQYLDPDSWVLFGVGPDDSGKSVLKMWQGGAAEDDGKPTIKSGPEVVPAEKVMPAENQVRAVLSTYYHENSAMVMFTDSERGLYSSVHTSDKVELVPLSNVEKGAAAIGAIGEDRFIRFYGADPDGNLWVLHQTGWAADDSPEWAPIFPFDRDVKFVATPVAEAASGELAAVRPGGKLDLIRQSESTGLWRRRGIHQRGKKTMMETTRYRTLLSVSDESGVPSPDTEVTITPSELVALEVGGKTVVASPDSPATVKSDMTGAIEFTQPATGLDAVTFDVTADAADPVSVTPHAYLHALLAGPQLASNQPIFTGGPASSMTIPPLTADSLRAATVDGEPLADGLTPDMAGAAAAGINQAASLVAPGAKTTSARFALDLDPSAPKFTPLRNEAAVSAAREQLPEHPIVRQAALAGDLRPAALTGDAIGEFFGDLWHAIKTGVITVVHWVVDTAKGVVSAVVKFAEDIAKGVTRLVELAWKGVSAVASFIHGVFAAIGVAVEKVVKWLKDFFDWSSIWKTMEVFNGYIADGLNAVESSIELAEGLADEFFGKLESEIDEQFDAALAILGENPVDPSGRLGVGGAGPLATLPGSQAQHRWLTGKVISSPPALDPNALDSDLSATLGSQLIDAIDKSGFLDKLQSEIGSAQKFSSDFSSPQEFVRVLLGGQPTSEEMRDFLEFFKGLVGLALAAADVLVTLLLELAADAVHAVRDALDKPLDSPVLEWVWEHLLRPSGNDDQLTAGRLASLVLAVPVTLAFKLTTGRGPFQQPRELGAVAPTRLAPAALDSTHRDDLPRDLVDTGADLLRVQAWGSVMLALIDAGNDRNSVEINMDPTGIIKRDTLPLNLADAAANLMIQATYKPDGWFSDWFGPATTYGERLTNGTWIGYFVPTLGDVLFAVLDDKDVKWKIDDKEIPLGAIWDFAAGAIVLGTGVAGAVYQHRENPRTTTGWDIAAAVLGPLPWMGQPLLLEPVIAATEGWSQAAQYLLDFAGDIDWYACVGVGKPL